MPQRPPDKDRVARILSDAKVYGDETACKRHKISRKTLLRYRKLGESVPEVSQKVAETQKVVEDTSAKLYVTWLEEAAATRRKLLERVQALALLSDDLHDVAGAYKIVNDGMLADRAVGALDDAEDEENGGRAGSSPGLAEKDRRAEEIALRAGNKLAH